MVTGGRKEDEGPTRSNQKQSSSAYITANERSGEEHVFNDDSLEVPPSTASPPSPQSSPSLKRGPPPHWIPPSTIIPEACLAKKKAQWIMLASRGSPEAAPLANIGDVMVEMDGVW
ncbi:MAG: hypothetical protein Q9218_004081 [Villophora microphyllina]